MFVQQICDSRMHSAWAIWCVVYIAIRLVASILHMKLGMRITTRRFLMWYGVHFSVFVRHIWMHKNSTAIFHFCLLCCCIAYSSIIIHVVCCRLSVFFGFLLILCAMFEMIQWIVWLYSRYLFFKIFCICLFSLFTHENLPFD